MLHRRQVIALLAGTAGVMLHMAGTNTALAQAWPERPVRIIVGYSAGGGVDIAARLVADELSRQLGHPFVVENMPGASGTIGADEVKNAAPDGYTLLMGAVAELAMAPAVLKNVSYDARKDFAPAALVAVSPLALIVSGNIKANTFDELLAFAKSRPGELRYGSAGLGTSTQLVTELLMQQAQIKMLHVPYNGSSAARSDVVAGHIDLTFDAVAGVAPLVLEGTVRALGVTSSERVPALPAVPTFAEQGLPELVAGSWFGLLAPAGTPPEIVKKIAAALTTALSGDLSAKFVKLGLVPQSRTLEDFGVFIGDEMDRWAEVVKNAAPPAAAQ